jgi:hypothetical protein
MATNFPTSLDSFTNPTAVDTLDSPPHDEQHADANDAIEALQAKVGVDGSAVATSHDYILANMGTWTAYTPVLDQNGTVAATVSSARYTRINDTVIGQVRLNVTGTGTANQSLKVSLPVTANNTIVSAGIGDIYDSSTGTMYDGFLFVASADPDNVLIVGDWAGNGVWGTSPNLAITNGDVIWLQFNYEAA